MCLSQHSIPIFLIFYNSIISVSSSSSNSSATGITHRFCQKANSSLPLPPSSTFPDKPSRTFRNHKRRHVYQFAKASVRTHHSFTGSLRQRKEKGGCHRSELITRVDAIAVKFFVQCHKGNGNLAPENLNAILFSTGVKSQQRLPHPQTDQSVWISRKSHRQSVPLQISTYP